MKIEEIKRDFGLESNDITEIRKQLRDIVKEIHPDKNEGKFKNQLDEQNYHKAIKAIEFLDQDFSLVPKVELTALASLIGNNFPSKGAEIRVKTLEDRGVSLMKTYRDSTLFPKVSSTVIAGILSFLWLFPSAIAEHPILSKYLTADNLIFTGLWIYSLVFSGIYWLNSKRSEERADAAIKRLNLESVQNRFLKLLLSWKYPQERS